MPTNFDHVIRFMELLRAVYVDMTLSQAQTFLAVAENKHLTQTTLSDMLGLSSSAVSRNIYVLSTGSRRVEGLGLINVDLDPHDRRYRVVTLTPKGRSLVQSLHDQLELINVRKKEG